MAATDLFDFSLLNISLLSLGISIGVSILQVICNRTKTRWSPLTFVHYATVTLQGLFTRIGGLYAKITSYITFYWVFEFIIKNYRKVFEFLRDILVRIRGLLVRLKDFLKTLLVRLKDLIVRIVKKLKIHLQTVIDLITEVFQVQITLLSGLFRLLMTPMYIVSGYYNEIVNYKYYFIIRYLTWALILAVDRWNNNRVFDYLYEFGNVCSQYTLLPAYNYLFIKLLIIFCTAGQPPRKVARNLIVLLSAIVLVPAIQELHDFCQQNQCALEPINGTAWKQGTLVFGHYNDTTIH